MEIRHFASGDVQRGGLADARGLLQNHGSVRAAHEAVGAGDHVERVLRLLLAGVVHHQDRDVEAVGDGFQRGHDFVIPRVAVLLRLHLPDALQRVDDHEADAGVSREEVAQLLLKTASQKLRLRGDPDPVGLAAGHLAEATLDALGRVLQTDVQHVALRRLEIPDLLALADPISQPQDQPAFADLGSAGKEVDPLAQQLFDQPAGWLKLHVHELIGVHGVQLRDPLAQRALNVADGLSGRHARVLAQHIVQQVAPPVTVHAKPGVVLHESGQIAADRTGCGDLILGQLHMRGFQIVPQPRL